MCRGDVELQKTEHGEEYLEFNEIQTTTRTESDYRNVRTVSLKMFPIDGTDKDPLPVVVYK